MTIRKSNFGGKHTKPNLNIFTSAPNYDKDRLDISYEIPQTFITFPRIPIFSWIDSCLLHVLWIMPPRRTVTNIMVSLATANAFVCLLKQAAGEIHHAWLCWWENAQYGRSCLAFHQCLYWSTPFSMKFPSVPGAQFVNFSTIKTCLRPSCYNLCALVGTKFVCQPKCHC